MDRPKLNEIDRIGQVPVNVSPDYNSLKDAFQSPWNGNSNIFWIKSDFIWNLRDKLS